MPVKIAFRVIEASSEDEGFKALELNVQKPTAEGWRSRRGSAFPQHLLLELDREVLIKKIQVLSHHCMIAQCIDFFVGKATDNGRSSEEIVFTELGRVHLASRVTYKVRELKSVYVKAVGRFVKLVFSEAHKDELNVHGQVSLLAVNVLGDVTFDEAGAKVDDPNERTVDQYSPLDDLSFLMYQDPLVVQVIKQLEMMKTDGTDESRNVGSLISELEKIGKKLVELEAARRRATEDLRKKNFLEKEIEDRRNVVQEKVKHLNINALLPERIQSSTPVKIVGSQPTAQSSLVVPQGHPKSSIPKSPSTPKSLPAKEMKSPDWLTPQPMETPRSNAYYDYNERPLPTHRKGQESRLGEVTEVDEEPTRDSESGFGDQAEDLSEKEEKEAEYIIEVFGMPTAREIFSKKWNCKQRGLENISRFLSAMCNHGNDDTDDRNTADDNSNNNNDDQSVELLKKMSKQTLINVVKALEQVVLRVSRDNIVSVFKALLNVYRNFLLNFVPSQNTPKLDLFLQHTLPPLLSRLGDISSRPREMTSSLILELLRSHEFKYKNVLLSECFKMNKQGVTPKVVLGVTEVIFTIYLERGMKNSGLTWDSLLKHLKDIMSNSCSNVRKFTKDFLSRLHEDLRRDEHAAMAARVKNLLSEFDSIDKKPKGEAAVAASRSEEKPKVDARKSSLVESGVQKPLVQNQVNKHPEKENKIIKRSVLAKPFKIPKENLPSQKPSSVVGSEQNPKRQNVASKMILGKNSPHRRSLPSVKMPKVVPAVTKKPAAAQTRRLPPKQQQHRSISKDQQLQCSEDKKAKKRSFSLDRREVEESIDRPVIVDKGEQKTKSDERVCVFCGKEGVVDSLDVVDQHYLTGCPMLICCEHCKKMVEVSNLNAHRIDSCPRKELFKKCPRCRQAILADSVEGHCATNKCKGLGDHEELCPICGSTIPNNEKSWMAHLTRPGLCCRSSKAEPNC